MRKRISKQKEKQQWAECAEACGGRASPLLSLRLLIAKTECVQNTLKFEKERIDRIVAGRGRDSINFQEVDKNCSFEELLERCLGLGEIKQRFTGVIQRNCLTASLTFVDFKLKNFIIMNRYAHQLRQIAPKDNSETKLTASRSSLHQRPAFKQQELQVKRLTKRPRHPRNDHTHAHPASFTNLLSKNVDRIRRNNRDSRVKAPLQVEFKPVLGSRDLLEEGICEQLERLHTTPEQGFDSYGLSRFRNSNLRKLEQISLMSRVNRQPQRPKLQSEKSQDTLRFQTEYDTEKIQSRRSKSKKNLVSFKKSASRSKAVSGSKASSLITALQRRK